MTDDPLDRPFPISGHESKRYGAITSFENADGRTLSTPATVYGDLQGARIPSGNGKQTTGSQTVHVPEYATVGGSGRDGWQDAPR